MTDTDILQHPYDAVNAFHEAFDLPRSTAPALPGTAVRDLRKSLLAEEWQEYLTAESEDDIVEIADALADMIYIACGTAVAYGIPLDKVFAEVHHSNMAKLVDGKVIRREDGKVLKPAGWKPPDVKGVMGL
jgi:predicted HAD superfamily Cof-like phosphohydrolase